MNLKIGDKVRVLGVRFSSGTHYIKEYELHEIASDHIKLKHIRNITKNGDEIGNGEILKERLETLNYLSTSFRERYQKCIDDLNWLRDDYLSKEDVAT